MNGLSSPGQVSKPLLGSTAEEDLRTENGRLRRRLEDAERRTAAASAAQVGCCTEAMGEVTPENMHAHRT